MGDKTAIAWTHGGSTWNPWMGCTKVSAGCDNCYAERLHRQWNWPDFGTVRRSKTRFNDPLSWKEGRMVFTCSLSDWFHKDADAWRPEAWAIVKATPQHTYQILTKRPGRIARHLPADWGDGYPNVWLGVSVEDQQQAHRMGVLECIPARVRFVSAEPLLGPLTLVRKDAGVAYDIDWLIVGGESGPNDARREMDLTWAAQLRDECRDGRPPIAFFFKQISGPRSEMVDGVPPDLLVREYPLISTPVPPPGR